MKFTDQLRRAERRNDSLLCVGLDPDPAKFPGAWKGDAGRIYDFCSAIVDATKDLVIAFKPQIAYFASHRAEDQLERLMAHIKRVAPEVPVILDAKRGDIGPTAEQYAREAFERYQADAVTLSPFMGFDSLEPWLRYGDRGLILLCRTSNPGGSDLQAQPLANGTGGELVYERVARLAQGDWNRSGQLGLVVGATFPGEIARVRELAPTLPLLIPGVGAQGGDAAATVRAGWRAEAPIVVNSSRAVLYASNGDDFASAARRVAQATRVELNAHKPAA
ncbi:MULTISPECIES: orotidine-5'-phosphate decarboxylase [unclassified Rhizobacter]|uniref:orotidine-5'-phosphate decarboxylase n=1 Tax=unclassified Rhizobacter TaxID=2640088 RepID=UPI0007016E8D|nr:MULTISPECIES: orotidine-5'-phosphate decarboxylase [unclassified Rhizobacter]KQU78412.1 Orotidine 5'-phosphate decarboxylase [Rhizobacter sp. Root29]KQW10932.1 Orotidine 5'-phosphate decarboxylase [Rhizobacter sp. Root1238]KRB25278.1 Orotidine 5'-phosphate decarboxylase [Rhizobacter sp. Root16D2]